MTRRERVSAICRAYRSGASVAACSARFAVDGAYVLAALRARAVPLRVTGPCDHERLHASRPCTACIVARDNALRAAQEAARKASPRGAAQRAERLAAAPVTCCYCSRETVRAQARGIGRGWMCREGYGCAAPRATVAA